MEDNESAHKGCTYCAEKILAAAKKCKHCGEFLETSNMPPVNGKAQLIEATSKPYKFVEGIGALLIFLSLLAWIKVDFDTCIKVFILGCLMYFGGRVAGWWKHG